MLGLYIHIPFCKQACVYCDFHFSTNLNNKADLIKAIKAEILLSTPTLANKKLSSIYFGGGTPSLLNENEIQDIFETIYKTYTVSSSCEITLEANPDDLTNQKLKELSHTPINRLSIGVQSFHEKDLIFMKRAHDSKQAHLAIMNAQDIGFENLTIDLIYGLPNLTKQSWLLNINSAIKYDIPHISSYSLTIEPKTELAYLVKKQNIKIPEKNTVEQYWLLCETLNSYNYEHYEVSNFCKTGKYSLHNSAYWRGSNYLGIGPSAHSFIERKRSSNIANNNLYIKSVLSDNKRPNHEEDMSYSSQYNDYIITRLRAKWGINEQELLKKFGEQYYNHFSKQVKNINPKHLNTNKNALSLTDEGMLFSDSVFVNLMTD